jgi:thioredoxin reductase (NADPH)
VDLDLTGYPFKLRFIDGRTVLAESIIVALGTSKRWLGLPSEEALKGKGVSGSASCDGPLFQGREVVVVGNGDAALEEALALTEFASKVTLINRAEKFRASAYLQERIFAHPKIHVIWSSEVEDILDVTQNRVTAIVLRHFKTQELTTYPCEGVFVAIGRRPNTDLFKGQLELSPSGLIVADSMGTQTSVLGVFAAGDVSDPTYRKAITAAATGCMAAMDANRFLNMHLLSIMKNKTTKN